LALRIVEERLGLLGRIIRFVGDVAWTLASTFVIPIVAVNQVGPIDALKLSANVFKQRWSSVVRVNLRLGLYMLGLVVGGAIGVAIVVAAANASVALALVLGIVLGGAFLVAVLVLSALGAYSKVALYRYSSGMTTPGFSEHVLASAFTTLRRASRWA